MTTQLDGIQISDAFVRAYREWSGDTPDNNRLYQPTTEKSDGFESPDSVIKLCAKTVISSFNASPPILGILYQDDQSFPNALLLLLGTHIQVIKRLIAIEARNAITFQDQGLTIGLGEKGQRYEQMLSSTGMLQEFAELQKSTKEALNAEGAYMYMPSAESFYSYWDRDGRDW